MTWLSWSTYKLHLFLNVTERSEVLFVDHLNQSHIVSVLSNKEYLLIGTLLLFLININNIDWVLQTIVPYWCDNLHKHSGNIQSLSQDILVISNLLGKIIFLFLNIITNIFGSQKILKDLTVTSPTVRKQYGKHRRNLWP